MDAVCRPGARARTWGRFFRALLAPTLPQLVYLVIAYMELPDAQVCELRALRGRAGRACGDVRAPDARPTAPTGRRRGRQIEAWSESPEQYVVDEDEEVANYSVRDAGERLVTVRLTRTLFLGCRTAPHTRWSAQ